jgi:hypothetical protein
VFDLILHDLQGLKEVIEPSSGISEPALDKLHAEIAPRQYFALTYF